MLHQSVVSAHVNAPIAVVSAPRLLQRVLAVEIWIDAQDHENAAAGAFDVKTLAGDLVLMWAREGPGTLISSEITCARARIHGVLLPPAGLLN